MVRLKLCLAAASLIAWTVPAMAETAAAPSVVNVDTPATSAAPSKPAVSLAAVTATDAPKPAPEAPAIAAAPVALPKPPKPETTLLIDIDLARQRMAITEYGKLFGSWAISSGRAGFRSPTGSFRPLWAARMWYSKKYDNAPMPHAVFFSGGVAMHATQATGQLGQPASHGCIRQSPANAATTYRLVEKHGNAHTRIVVHGTPHDDEPRLARHERRDFSPAFGRIESRQARIVRPDRSFQPAGMRRVILVDGYGNRRIAEIPASDPRLLAYQRRVSAMASGSSSY